MEARVQPLTPARLVEEIAAAIAQRSSGRRLRVLIDGPPAARPTALADLLVAPLAAAGLPVVRVSAEDFLRPASLRLELGRTDPDSYYENRLDTGALTREVLGPLGPDGSGRHLPTLRDPVRDRPTRAGYRTAPDGAVLLLDGGLLLGRGLPAEISVHLALTASALRRRTEDAERWTLPAFERYEEEVGPQRVADLVVKADDPAHPALLRRRP